MVIGNRLKEMRESKNLSQGDIEKRSGLLRCYMVCPHPLDDRANPYRPTPSSEYRLLSIGSQESLSPMLTIVGYPRLSNIRRAT